MKTCLQFTKAHIYYYIEHANTHTIHTYVIQNDKTQTTRSNRNKYKLYLNDSHCKFKSKTIHIYIMALISRFLGIVSVWAARSFDQTALRPSVIKRIRQIDVKYITHITSFGVTAWTCMCELPRCIVHWTRLDIGL